MLPSNESILFIYLEQATRHLRDNPSISAYPMLAPVLHQTAFGMEGVINSALDVMRREAFDGTTPWAKLYEMMTGKRICLPDMGIIEDLTADPRRTSWVRGFSQTFNYFIDNWDNPEGDEEFVLFMDDTDPANQICIDIKTHSATISYSNNDLEVKLGKFYNTTASITSPLFHEPYMVSLKLDFIRDSITKPMEKLMMSEYGVDKDYTAASATDFANVVFLGTREEPIDPGEDSSFAKMIQLLRLKLYSKYGQDTAYIDWRGYRLEIKSADLFITPYGTMYIMLYDVHPNDSRPTRVEDWWTNPILTYDLAKELPGLLDRTLELHELSLKEVD